MGVGRSPFIHCSQRLLFGEMGGPSSLQDAAAGLSGGGGGVGALWEPYPPLPQRGTLAPASTPLLGDCSLVPVFFPGAAR